MFPMGVNFGSDRSSRVLLSHRRRSSTTMFSNFTPPLSFNFLLSNHPLTANRCPLIGANHTSARFCSR